MLSPSRFHDSRVQGFTLVQLMLSLGIIAVLGTATLVAWKSHSERMETAAAVENTRTLGKTLMQTYGQTGSFEGLNETGVINGKLLPRTLQTKNNTITNRWGGTVNVGPQAGNDRVLSIAWTNVPAGACSGMVSAMAKDGSTILVNGTQAQTAGVRFDPGVAANLCKGGANRVDVQSPPVALASTGELDMPPDQGGAIAPPASAPVIDAVGSAGTLDGLNAPVALGPMNTAHSAPSGSTVNGNGAGVSGPVVSATPPPAPGAAQSRPCNTRLSAISPNPKEERLWVKDPLSCPPGYTGSHTREKEQRHTSTASCASPQMEIDPVWGEWSAWADTGATRNDVNSCVATCSTRLATGGWPGQSETALSAVVNAGCPAGYSGAHTYQKVQVRTRSAFCADGNAAADPGYGGWGAWVDTGGIQNDSNTCAQTLGTWLATPVGCSYNSFANGSVGAMGGCTTSSGQEINITEPGFWNAWDPAYYSTIAPYEGNLCTISDYYANRPCDAQVSSPQPPPGACTKGQTMMVALHSVLLNPGQSGQIQDWGIDESKNYTVYRCQ
jgi:type II secretory pathway pseudopilin PulG